ncbi:MAG: haloacid dehalogenase type II [Gallionella sp.]
MAITLGFDVYGTLIDLDGIIAALERIAGDKAAEFTRIWRDKQLEYSFRRGLMQNYENFSVCTGDAFDYTSALLDVPFSPAAKAEVMSAYRTLPAFDDVAEGLARARQSGHRIYAFSNGRAEAVETLLRHAGIREYFIGVISTDEMKSYKPNPGVYSHFLRRAGALGADAWLVSSNPFDVIGAISSGMRAAWVKRSPQALFDPWGIEPTLTIKSLLDLSRQVGEQCSRA